MAPVSVDAVSAVDATVATVALTLLSKQWPIGASSDAKKAVLADEVIVDSFVTQTTPPPSDLRKRSQAGTRENKRITASVTLSSAPGATELTSPPKRKITLQELAKHSERDDLWIAISGKVYDMTEWKMDHPGGMLPLLAVAGGDATDAFRAFHPKSAWDIPSKFYVGCLVSDEDNDTSPPRLSPEDLSMINDFRDLQRKIKAAGLLKPDPLFYLQRGAVMSLVFAAVVAGVVLTKSTALHMLCAVVLGLWWNQVNFIGHDAGHNAITGVRAIDSAIGFFVGNVLTGISIGWWKKSHNVHHIVCNSVNYDPDLQHVPVFAVSNLFFQSQYSFYHFRKMTFDALARLLISHQHFTFYPIMFVARINLYIQSLIHLGTSDQGKVNVPLELATMGMFWTWYITLLMQLPSFWEMFFFFWLSHGMTAILHVQICMSHFAAPTYEGRKDSQVWMRTQLECSINIDCPTYMDWFFGGLQFQIEHHVFPRMPRRNLRTISPWVQEYCKKHSIPYCAYTFLDANILTVKMLRKEAMNARKLTFKGGANQAESAFFQSLLWDALNARG